MNAMIEKMRKDGYPYKIRGNDGHKAVLYDMQPLNDGRKEKAMKTGTKALHTDIVKVMQGIVNSHVEHYQSDFELDITAQKQI